MGNKTGQIVRKNQKVQKLLQKFKKNEKMLLSYLFGL